MGSIYFLSHDQDSYKTEKMEEGNLRFVSQLQASFELSFNQYLIGTRQTTTRKLFKLSTQCSSWESEPCLDLIWIKLNCVIGIFHPGWIASTLPDVIILLHSYANTRFSHFGQHSSSNFNITYIWKNIGFLSVFRTSSWPKQANRVTGKVVV